jgi:polyisoprenoid-binding protein YceI
MSFPAWSAVILWLLAAPAQDPRPQPAAPDHYAIDAAASRFTATIGTVGLLSTFGHEHTVALRDFSGDVRLSEDDVEAGSLTLRIRAASLGETGMGWSDEDRKSIDQDIREQALEVTAYPEIVFQSSAVSSRQIAREEYQIEIQGQLTLHGVTRPVTVPARVTVHEGTLTANGKFMVLHRDYKIRRLSAVAGTIKASDEIWMNFEIVARKK